MDFHSHYLCCDSYVKHSYSHEGLMLSGIQSFLFGMRNTLWIKVTTVTVVTKLMLKLLCISCWGSALQWAC